MKNIWKKLVIAFLWCLSKLPFPLLYLLSSFMARLLENVYRYRRGTVERNLGNAFPEKTKRQIIRIRKKFYRNFSDFIFEVIKTRSITQKQLSARIHFDNFDLIRKYFQQQRSIIVVIGHCGNFEWTMNYLQMLTDYRVNPIVKPLKDPFFENYLKDLRTRFNPKGQLIPLQNALRMMMQRKNEQTITVIAGDQTPPRREINFWTKFLNQDTPVFTGIERIAKKLNHVVLFFDIQREKRGHYRVDISLLDENPSNANENELTEKHVKILEKAIEKHPDNWLWSHRRWKHKK